jgi:ABC-type transporter Mla subunit MlaD
VAQSGNGVDLGTIYQLLSEVAETVRSHSDQFARVNRRLDGVDVRLGEQSGVLNQQVEKLNELIATVNTHSRRFDDVAQILNGHGGKLDDLSFGLSDLRSTVADYNQTVAGHGIRSTELEERVDRIERHLKLESN